MNGRQKRNKDAYPYVEMYLVIASISNKYRTKTVEGIVWGYLDIYLEKSKIRLHSYIHYLCMGYKK